MAVHDDKSISSRGELQAHITIAFLVLTWFFIALRVWTRTYVISNFGWDDSSMILAGMMFTVYCASMLILESNGGGTHVTNVGQMIMLTKWVIVSEAMYVLTIMVLKISLAIFFARIVVKQWQLTTIYIAVAVNIISSLASFFYVFLRCGPDLDKYVYNQLAWNCTPKALDRFIAFQQASFTTLTDIVFVLLPVLILWNASMNLRSKISVGLILSLATLGSICSILRFRYVDGLTQIEDFFWNAINIGIWSTIEPGAGIIAGCLATLRPFFKSFVNRALSIRSSTTHSVDNASRSIRSPESSSNKKSGTSNSECLSDADRSREGVNIDPYHNHNQSFELTHYTGNGPGTFYNFSLHNQAAEEMRIPAKAQITLGRTLRPVPGHQGREHV
ncbi:hypothetical protein BDV95DRAFT_604366 [Massariosphaeria phaeospora]|uniref:Rhodopsin domain-containing protein n=1 Tax=Massariosphaeria phaeospora TaxID=100035 RepID=A0A7C8I9X0_9PLEO|nr:hypothetical protein BDV95DRAFT_604366 [Massariosphaeria phaeospora]